MRQWMVDPKCLCRQHLLGEHNESHSFLGCIKKGTSLKGYISKGLVEVDKIQKRHDELAEEMIRRGYNHKSPLDCCNLLWEEGCVDSEQNIEELKRRCPECRERILNAGK
jgi:hypothetical protein